ncbi:Rpn family recombination-promoting nuclease/putative transposase [Natronosporangium hydrolyticum]|uniref:Rpn family recombination-promoting nuclease/putative transposase n=1 Tax=Natronosporangium hydrolyticum TaxID=2811111 RepID=A0A895YDK4_9ACTN|nr:Rpn family recombination-promoting nuclease/putative transposase [Natronosporangium hydrolyticum]QSB14252.1 Rpn family recombination-promoting nuclease/putative transposase [Natronosporangium hydrolyticum]
MSGDSSPHDAVFRRMLGEPANAASQLRAVLPPELADQLDLARLTRLPGSFVDAKLRWRHSDLLFTAPLAGGDGHSGDERSREAFIYVLVEHQSGTDKLMPLRILRYMVRIWDAFLNEHPRAHRLPAVFPLVVHHNRQAWDAPTELADLLDLDPGTVKAAGEFLPRLRFLLDDLTVVDEAALRARPVTAPVRLTLLLLKIAAGNAGLADDLRRWSDQLQVVLQRPSGIEDFVTMLTYIQQVGEVPAQELYDLFAGLGPTVKEAFVTTAEQLRAEGEARGEARGEVRGRAEALTQFLTHKFGPLPPDVHDRVHTATVEELERWTGRVVTARTLAEALD